jgi:2',3'-cyclic-nucleotide 2'-phosphodiesterase
MVKVLFLGEIVGIPTINIIKKSLKELIAKYKIDLTIANGDGASDGYGILKNSAFQLNKSGIDIITSGDYVYNKKDARDMLSLGFFLKPYNLPQYFGGNGYSIIRVKEVEIGIINILGRIHFNKIFASCPFYSVTKAIEKLKEKTKIIIVDFHGGATSEVQAMHWHLAGKASLVVGSHLRVLTTDNRIIANKTAVITGAGFCGAKQSVGGLEPFIEINKFRTGQYFYSKIGKENIRFQGVIAEIDEASGDAKKIEILNENIG